MSLVNTVREAGIIGAGGAGFPAHVKVDCAVEMVIANGAECEPLLNTDQRVMEHFADEVVDGLLKVQEAVGAKRAIIGLKAHYHEAIAALRKAIGEREVELALLKNFYPSGDEQILVTEITGRVVPEGGIPLQVGIVVCNVATLMNMSRAVRGQVVTTKEVTLVGEIDQPQVTICPVGTPIRHLLQLAGPKLPDEELVVIDGGPMMGNIVSLDGYVKKTTSGLIFLSKHHELVRWKQIPMEWMLRRSAAACCQCRDCTEVCSRHLQGHRIQPHMIMRGLAYPERVHDQAMFSAFLCSQCGLCEFACPLNLSPKMAYAEVLKTMRAKGVQNPLKNAPTEPHEFNATRKIDKRRLTRRYDLEQYDSHSLPLRRLSAPPPMVGIVLNQAIGTPSVTLVGVGDLVTKGQLIARIADGKLGANHHASVAGRVVRVDSNLILIAEQNAG
ncbi:MAG: hypothetical protein CO108_26915 [Deltaproteobacteria bacterium CG_4_9_14_3_um_filter_63_12]|nr:MAG: hypothetical protein CO108_26915 [Deltaproteobacteria bacterium CG_4_9_14_3_um_filter_63_12]